MSKAQIKKKAAITKIGSFKSYADTKVSPIRIVFPKNTELLNIADEERKSLSRS